MGKKKDKQKLYEYQYTTPNKTVVKEFLPAVQKPTELRSYQEKLGGNSCSFSSMETYRSIGHNQLCKSY